MRSMQIMKIKPPGTVNPPSGNPTCTNQNAQLVSQSRPCGFAVPFHGIWAEQWCSGGMKLGTELRHRAGCNLCSFLGWLCSCSELDECFSKVWRPPMWCSWICCCWLSPLKQLIKETKNYLLQRQHLMWIFRHFLREKFKLQWTELVFIVDFFP